MRLITLPLFAFFAFLLAVSAFGQDDAVPTSTVLIETNVLNDLPDETTGVRRGSVRRCNGVVLSRFRKWVLTAASCVGWDGGGFVSVRNSGNTRRQLAAQVWIHPDRRTGPLQQAGRDNDLALISMPCSIDVPAAMMIDRKPVVGGAFTGDVPSWSVGESVDAGAAPYQRTDANNDRWYGVEGVSAINGAVTFQGSHWIGLYFSSLGDRVDVAPGMPLYVGGNVVGILSGTSPELAGFGAGEAFGLLPGIGGVFTDITNEDTWEWITRTMRNESLYLPEVCGYTRR